MLWDNACFYGCFAAGHRPWEGATSPRSWAHALEHPHTIPSTCQPFSPLSPHFPPSPLPFYILRSTIQLLEPPKVHHPLLYPAMVRGQELFSLRASHCVPQPKRVISIGIYHGWMDNMDRRKIGWQQRETELLIQTTCWSGDPHTCPVFPPLPVCFLTGESGTTSLQRRTSETVNLHNYALFLLLTEAQI